MPVLMRFLVAALFAAAQMTSAQSFYPVRLQDKAAVYATGDRFPLKGDGVADDTDGLQKAIDTVADTTGQGLVFLPEGKYRISRTVYVWPGVRVIGYGAHRPVILLGDHTAGFQAGPSYMVLFAGGRTGEARRGGAQPPANAPRPALPPFPGTVPPRTGVVDANPGTFYSAMSNIDFDLGEGNPGAAGIRFHIAQHCFLTHMEFRIRSGMAALYDVGNEAHDLHFVGGEHGIVTGRPSPGWQFTLLDSTFEGQRGAAILEHEAGLVAVNDTFRNVPAAVEIQPDAIEELWIKDARFEHISGPAVIVGREQSRLTEINLQNIACAGVPVFLKLRDSGKTFAGPKEEYRVKHFLHGLTFDTPASKGVITSRTEFEPAETPSVAHDVIRTLSGQTGWANAMELGARGDGITDDTAALQRIVDEHPIVYLPSGRYRLTDTLRLKPDTVLIGLHPSTTQLDLNDDTPGFTGAGSPKPLLLAPEDGTNIVSGIGLWTGGSNNLATAALWRAGKDSMMEDVRFLGGHGTNNPDGSRMNPYNSTHGGDPNPHYVWDAQYPSLWVDGGGGTFVDIWTPDTFAQAGLYVTNTSVEGHVYELSSEHHVRNEVVLRGVKHWEIVALQTEEERGEGGACLPLSIQDSEDVTVAEMHAYRVVSSFVPYPETIHVSGSHDIRFRNLHIYSDSKAVFDTSVHDETSGTANRELEIASLTLPGAETAHLVTHAPPVPARTAVKQLATGFFNATSAVVDPQGRLYFVDTVKQHIFRYDPGAKHVEMVSDHPIDPANLFFDRSGDLMIVSSIGNGTVYTMKPDDPAGVLTLLKPQPAAPHPGITALLAADHWRVSADPEAQIDGPRSWQYLSPDGTVFLPAGNDFVGGALYYGTKMADVLRAFTLEKALPGATVYVTDEKEKRTYAATLQPDGSLAGMRLFVENGGEGAITGPDSLVYVAAGQVLVYKPDGTFMREIAVPERPTSLAFGGADGRTLFILARTSLYAARP